MSAAGVPASGGWGTDSESDRLLTVEQVAERLGTGVRFPRRLIAERRIRFVHVGRHVRIAEKDLKAFVAAGMVDVLPRRGGGR